MDAPAKVVHTNFFAKIDGDNCTICGACEEICPMDAITIEDTAKILPERCIGCGVCTGACEFDAISVHQKQKNNQYLPPKDMVHMQMEIAKERGLM